MEGQDVESAAATAKKNERLRLQAEIKVKQESFVKKERVFKTKIEVVLPFPSAKRN